MRTIRSHLHLFVMASLGLLFAIIDCYPTYGPPFFRYTGADPKLYVWNFGWPMSWTIFDHDTPPHWFLSPLPIYYILLVIQVGIFMIALLALRLLRKSDSEIL